jgi:hypothetical protein
MLKNTKELYGTRLAASDGDIGHVKDFYFDDKNWVVRYVVADTGSWLTGRLVLLSPHALGRFDQGTGALSVNLARAKIESSPSIETHRPVSRQYEIAYYRYYGWPAYWNGGAMWGLSGYPVPSAPSKAETADRLQLHHRSDKHLQSARSIIGYGIQAIDGPIGSVSALMLNDRNWGIQEIVVVTGRWFSEKEVQISTKKVVRIDYEESKVFVSLSRADIAQTAANELAGASSIGFGAAGFRD